jgi:hypothetical protein
MRSWKTFEEAGRTIRDLAGRPTAHAGLTPVSDAIEAYKREMLPRDQPMQKLLKELEHLGVQGKEDLSACRLKFHGALLCHR